MRPAERAARALCSMAGQAEDSVIDGTPAWKTFLPHVRAVLAAIHEPSERMTEAGGEIIRGYNNSLSEMAYRGDAANIWRYMTDAMRKELE